jgi:hypothetical protein
VDGRKEREKLYNYLIISKIKGKNVKKKKKRKRKRCCLERISSIAWSATLAILPSSRFSETPCLKK